MEINSARYPVVSEISNLPVILSTKTQSKFNRDLSTVYHVGFMGGRGKPARSLEGNGLSISQNPEEWRKIAKLGGSPIYELTKANPKFYLAEREDQKALDWSITHGYLQNATKWIVWSTEEEGEEIYWEFDSEKEAKLQAGEENEAEIEKIPGYSFDNKGIQYWKASFSSKPQNNLATDFAPIFYAEALGYDGVWWEELLDVGKLSAPRGVIFQKKVPTWKVKKVKKVESIVNPKRYPTVSAVLATTPTIKPFQGTYYHQTSEPAAESILKNGFQIFAGGNQRFTEGVYLLQHKEGNFGDITLAVTFNGQYLDLQNDQRGKEWTALKDKFWEDNYTKLTRNIQEAFPSAQGIMLPNMLVVWDISTIQKVEQVS